MSDRMPRPVHPAIWIVSGAIAGVARRLLDDPGAGIAIGAALDLTAIFSGLRWS